MVDVFPLLAFREASWCPVLVVSISAVLMATICDSSTTCPQCSWMSLLSPGSVCGSARRVLCMFSTTVPLSTSHTHIALEVSGHPLLLQRRGVNVCSFTVSLIQMCFQLCLCIWWQVLLPLGACLQRAHVPARVCCPWKQTKLIKIIAGCHGSCCRCGLIGKAITAACWGVYREAVGRGYRQLHADELCDW